MTPETAPPPEPTLQAEIVPPPQAPRPPLSDRDVWLEVIAVLSIGVFPNIASAVTTVAAVVQPSALPAYWLSALTRCVYNGCAIVAVLYIIHRSGEPFSAFGVTRPGAGDVLLALTLFMAEWFLWVAIRPLLPVDPSHWRIFFPQPREAADYLLMIPAEASNGFAEELITRGYLITRLERLLGSRFQAVVLSAVLFASYHLYYGPTGALIYVLVFGLAFGGAYVLLRRVWPLALAHMLLNISIEVAM
jgi:membrane protease YdiL (CAAX protease family)